MKVKHTIGLVLICVLIPSCLVFGQQVRLPEGTPVHVRLKADLTGDQAEEGARVDFEVSSPVVIQGITVIPEGAVSWGAIQSVKKGKFIKFDIEGVRLPDLTDVKLRTMSGRAKNPAADQIKVDASFKGGVGAPKGTEFTAYVNEDRDVAAVAQPGSHTLAPASAAPAAAPPTLSRLLWRRLPRLLPRRLPRLLKWRRQRFRQLHRPWPTQSRRQRRR